jgi:hypothetical protein
MYPESPPSLFRLLCMSVLPGMRAPSFWDETPEVNERATYDKLGPYYMTFAGKAEYPGPFDSDGIPLLEYRRAIGRYYNPIAIAQYALGCYNRHHYTADEAAGERFFKIADWLKENLEANKAGVPVWNHQFDAPYDELVTAPTYSGVAQGQGISVLVRACEETSRLDYGDAATKAFQAFEKEAAEGGVVFRDADGLPWLEEYVVDPPSQILSGFLWALWGIYDFALWSGQRRARQLFKDCAWTLRQNLSRYDVGFWSLYELPAEGRAPVLASAYHHHLHVVQLYIMHRMAADDAFGTWVDRWEAYRQSRRNRWRAALQATLFKARQ